jgi:dienelactone hydrolase
MTTLSLAAMRRSWSPSRRPLRSIVIFSVAALVAIATITLSGLVIPEPLGSYDVGRYLTTWVDATREERHTAEPDDVRSLPLHVWYPALPETGTRTKYVENLAMLRADLAASGDFSWSSLLGLQWVRDGARTDATPVDSDGFPLLILSPGNQTNVVFYSALAEDLASRGYVVVGIDHPYQVAASAMPDGSVAAYDTSDDKPGSTAAKVKERVADIQFVVERVLDDPAALPFPIESDRLGVMGHSLGGLAAVEACRADQRIGACINIDGQGAGGPFGTAQDAISPDQPFLYLTKESAIHPEIASRFEDRGDGAFRVVIPAASHDDFTDGALFVPSMNPFSDISGDVVEASRGFVAAFLAQVFALSPAWDFDGIASKTNVFVNVFPLGDRAQIPAAEPGPAYP